MLPRALGLGLIFSSAIAIITPDAMASPQFTVKNDSNTKINVYIYKGNDSLCTLEEKLKSVSAGETDSFGCTGGGKGQCKVQFYAKGNEICKSARNTCSKNAIKVPGHSQISISNTSDSDYTCTLKGG